MNRSTATPLSMQIPVWLAPGLLLLGTILIGGQLGSLIRPLFVLGCGVVGWYAWRKGPAAHFYSALLLFAFAPFARRIVDVSVGFDNSSLMLIGPLLAILVPGIDLLAKWTRDAPYDKRLSPLIVVFFCIIYATILTIIQGNWSDVASGVLKLTSPMIYAAALAMFGDRDELLDAAASAFTVILPIMGVYAIYQYVDPPAWDRFWMQYASILSAGIPVPYGVRSFSTMAGPATYASFTATGLLLILFLRRSWLIMLLMLPAFMGFMLSQYRTAWIALGVGIFFGLLFRQTRLRAAVVIVGVIALGLLALTIPPFSDVIAERIASFGQGGQDGSAQERLQQYITLWALPDSSVIGSGFSTTDVGTAGAMAVDGMIISSWKTMGIPVGILCLFALVWAIWVALAVAFRERTVPAVVIGAFALGQLVQIPLAPIANAELGFLFWALTIQVPVAWQALSRIAPRLTAGAGQATARLR